MTTSSAALFPKKFTRVDSLTLSHHWYLLPQDDCFFLGEYTARKGFAYSATNQLILNLKKSVDRKGRPEWRYKEQAILTSGRAMRSGFKIDGLSRPNATVVPVPPSKAKTDPLYDDRMLEVVQEMCRGIDVDIRELVLQVHSTEPAHGTSSRPTPAEIAANYVIDESIAMPAPKLILVIDDVLTTGAHFMAMKTVLNARFPGVAVAGFFVARRVPDTTDFEDLF